MKVILVGHPGSQVIVPATEYLNSKYLPEAEGFELVYLNYKGRIQGWAKSVRNYLSHVVDAHIIFALDDYLISEKIHMKQFRHAESIIGKNGVVVCVKLGNTTVEEHLEYPVTTQYCIWDREYLMWLLEQVTTPWEFEIEGSKIFNKACVVCTCLEYNNHSSLSSKWEGLNLDGLNEEDAAVVRTMIEGEDVQPIKKKSRNVIFGGSGFLGTALIKRLIDEGNTNILAVARNEGSLVALKEKFPTVEIMVGDIADPLIVKMAMSGAQDVFLLSAMKHVGLSEVQVRSCVNTNLNGVMNVVGESLHSKPRLLMFISSDKAAQPSGVYGCSKKIGERLMAEAEQSNGDTMYRVVRYGNVWASQGSIATKWKPKLERGEEVILTDPEASRFFWTVDEAVTLMFECAEKATGASPYIPKMKAIKMGIVLEACMDVWGRSPVKIIGLQPGENKIETTDGITFSDQVEQFTKEEFINKFLCQK